MSRGRSGQAARPLLVLDGDSLAHRAYHALPKSIRGRGRPANMLVGFANMLLVLWDAERPRTVLAAFDTPTNSTYRNELFPGYQAGREFPPDLVEQLDRLPELVSSFGFGVAKAAGYEADDFLAAAARAETERGGRALLVTSDRDSFQLASDTVTILLPKRGVYELERVGPDEVRQRYGVAPHQVPDFIALRGDPSDRIPGAAGIGPAKAAAILREHGTLEAALEAGRFASQVDELRLYRRLAQLQTEAPLPELPDREPDWRRASALAEAWGLEALASRLRQRAEQRG